MFRNNISSNYENVNGLDIGANYIEKLTRLSKCLSKFKNKKINNYLCNVRLLWCLFLVGPNISRKVQNDRPQGNKECAIKVNKYESYSDYNVDKESYVYILI